MGFVKEFKEFAMKGNVMDMAVGVIIGGAFGKIVSSLVDDIIMPLIGKMTGGVSFTDLFVNLGEGNYQTLAAAKEAGAAVFANLNKKKEEEPAAPAGPTQEELLGEIRDLLKNK